MYFVVSSLMRPCRSYSNPCFWHCLQNSSVRWFRTVDHCSSHFCLLNFGCRPRDSSSNREASSYSVDLTFHWYQWIFIELCFFWKFELAPSVFACVADTLVSVESLFEILCCLISSADSAMLFACVPVPASKEIGVRVMSLGWNCP